MADPRCTRLLLAGLAIAGRLALGPAEAASDAGSLAVSATVKSNCDITGAALAFGSYVSGQTAPLDVIGLIDVSNCPNGVVRIELDGGGSGNTAARQMTSGNSTLSYQLYRDMGRSLLWGTGNIGKTLNLQSTSPHRVQVFGRVPGGQNVAPGDYSDTVTITMTF